MLNSSSNVKEESINIIDIIDESDKICCTDKNLLIKGILGRQLTRSSKIHEKYCLDII